MRILMVTNTYRPIVSGVARSIEAFEEEYRRLGHEVMVIAPEADEPAAENQGEVVRVPAIQHFNGSQFPLPVPAPGLVVTTVEEFRPDVIHAHHPFLMGSTAMRLARSRHVPLVFTYHTMWDRYTHYAAAESNVASKFIGALAAGYANLCDAVIAPSQSVADLLRERGVESRIEVIPTGVDLEHFTQGDGARFREKHGISGDALLVGYVGRLAAEKNLAFLARSVSRFMQQEPGAHFLVVGSGPNEAEILAAVEEAGAKDRLHLAGCCEGQELIDAYHALDIFAFASQSETQGMVLTEAMTSGTPVVALDGPGVRDVLQDGVNGRLVLNGSEDEFAKALAQVAEQGRKGKSEMSRAAGETAEGLSMPRQAQRVLRLYESLLAQGPRSQEEPDGPWSQTLRRLYAEWDLWRNAAHAASCALNTDTPVEAVSRA